MECSVYQVSKSGDIEFLQKGVDMSEILTQETIQRKDNLLHIAANWLQVEFARHYPLESVAFKPTQLQM